MVDPFFGSLRFELLNWRPWTTRAKLDSAFFAWIEPWHNPSRQHTAIRDCKPVDYKRLYGAVEDTT